MVDYGGNLAWHVYYYDENASSPGAYFTESLRKATRATKADIRTSTGAKKILMEDGKAAGVLTKAMAEKAARLSQPALGLTDHGYLFGAYEFYANCKKAGIKPIIGLEAYVTPAH